MPPAGGRASADLPVAATGGFAREPTRRRPASRMTGDVRGWYGQRPVQSPGGGRNCRAMPVAQRRKGHGAQRRQLPPGHTIAVPRSPLVVRSGRFPVGLRSQQNTLCSEDDGGLCHVCQLDTASTRGGASRGMSGMRVRRRVLLGPARVALPCRALLSGRCVSRHRDRRGREVLHVLETDLDWKCRDLLSHHNASGACSRRCRAARKTPPRWPSIARWSADSVSSVTRSPRGPAG
jgi:hypothetical protein